MGALPPWGVLELVGTLSNRYSRTHRGVEANRDSERCREKQGDTGDTDTHTRERRHTHAAQVAGDVTNGGGPSGDVP